MTRNDADRLNGAPAGGEIASGFGPALSLSAADFHDLALVHGPDLASWPAELRPAARAFAAGQPDAAESALAEAAALDAALGVWAAEAAPLPEDLFARMAADAEAALPGQAALGGASAPAPAPRRVVDPRRGRPAARRSGGARLLARLGAPAAFAASAMLGLLLGYAGDDPLSQGFAALAAERYEPGYEISLLDAELLSDEAFPDAEAIQ